MNSAMDKREKILRIIKENGEISKIEISKYMNVSKSSVIAPINAMIDEGLLIESGQMPGNSDRTKKGRRRVLLKINENYKFVVGVMLELEYVSIGISDLSGHVIGSVLYQNGVKQEASKLTELTAACIKNLLHDNCLKESELLGISISVNPSVIKTLNSEGVSLKSIKNEFSEQFRCSILCTNSVFAMSYYYLEFASDLNSPVDRQLFLYISDRTYITVIRNRTPVNGNVDCFGEYILRYDENKNVNECINDLLYSDPDTAFENLALLINNILCIFDGFNAVIYGPDLYKASVDKIKRKIIERYRHLEGKTLVFVLEKKDSFLGSCAMAVNQKL